MQVSANGVVLYSNSDIALRTQGQDIHIGYDTQSGNVEIGHNSSQTNINGTLNVNASKLVPVIQQQADQIYNRRIYCC